MPEVVDMVPRKRNVSAKPNPRKLSYICQICEEGYGAWIELSSWGALKPIRNQISTISVFTGGNEHIAQLGQNRRPRRKLTWSIWQWQLSCMEWLIVTYLKSVLYHQRQILLVGDGQAGRLPLSTLNDEKGGGARSQAPTPKHGKHNGELVDGGAEFGSRIRGRFFHPGIPGSAGLGLRPSTTLQMVHTLARALTTGIPISKKMLPYLFRNSPIDGLVHQKSNNPPGPGRVLESKLFIATLVDDGISMGDEPHMPLRINAHNNVVVERSARTDERGFLENQRKISGTSGEIFIVHAMSKQSTIDLIARRRGWVAPRRSSATPSAPLSQALATMPTMPRSQTKPATICSRVKQPEQKIRGMEWP
ncbi:predicted protein [Histoplasma capsulatum H143]|uniref:Uncharacterized protein n=1 Tax=Ajellomyces capsulatus (strain H143) TaxID=544712 RepID=C6HMV7_AJECH|nr:predicted protein [Histoplasma capsulatum H143]